MKITITFLIIFFCVVGASSQTTPRPAIIKGDRQALIFDSARFELIPALLSVVKIDRYTGKTYYLETPRGKWFPLEVRGGLPNEAGNATPKYQIHDAGNDLLVLFNNETGQGWFLNVRTWYPITD